MFRKRYHLDEMRIKFGQLHLFGMECNEGEMISKKFISDLRHDS